MLDMCGYIASDDLASRFTVEPSCGEGAFACEIARRLLASCLKHDRSLDSAANSLRIVDSSADCFKVLVPKLNAVFDDFDVSADCRSTLLRHWIVQDDYLLMAPYENVDFVIGNPPYVRSNDISADLKSAYLDRCETMTPGSDLFVGFFEIGLKSLSPQGILSFICADRWMHNSYGRRLRKLIAEKHSLDSLIVMHDVDAFESDVSAYPAITTISNKERHDAFLAFAGKDFSETSCSHLLADFSKEHPASASADNGDEYETGLLPSCYVDESSWPLVSPRRLEVLRYVESNFDPLELSADDTRVGIGMATGSDDVFLVDDPSCVEDESAVPIVTSKQLSRGTFESEPLWLVNPWNADGSLVNLAAHPKTKTYLESRREQLSKRAIAKKNPTAWYRTIDKYVSGLSTTPKLLIQDMHYRLEPYLDSRHYPHGNLYYIVSKGWNLKVLGGLLMSDICELFIDAYGVKMRGGTLRFQAQFLRKIRLPKAYDINHSTRNALATAFENKDYAAANQAARLAFNIPKDTQYA